MGLALGKDIQTDCSINAQLQGGTYCFGSKEAMAEFMKNPTENLAKAQAYYSKKHPGYDRTA
jgi:YHS domain-containing protein